MKKIGLLVLCFVFLIVSMSKAIPTNPDDWGFVLDTPTVPVEGHYLYWRIPDGVYSDDNRYYIAGGTIDTIIRSSDVVGLPANVDNYLFAFTAVTASPEGCPCESGYTPDMQKKPAPVIAVPTGAKIIYIYNGPKFKVTPGGTSETIKEN